MTLTVGGKIVDEIPIPRAALPPCHECDKPELFPENVLPVTVYQAVANQQTFGMMGHRLGLRFEAVMAAINEYDDEGYLYGVDRMQLRKRIYIMDRVVNELLNKKDSE